MKHLTPPNPKDRFEVYRFFNGISSEAKEGMDTRRLRVPPVKTFLLEHVACREGRRPKTPSNIFREIGADVRMLDDQFMSLTFQESDSTVTPGFLEQYDERFFAYYTCEDSEGARKRVNKWLQNSDLDATWFSSPLLKVLWNQDVSKRGDQRFGRLVFSHDSIFDMPEDFSTQGESLDDADLEATDEDIATNEDRTEFERRKARFEMKDRIGKIRRSLDSLQEIYEPLHALYAIRLPSRTGRGGHDLFQAGRVTNRTDSFEDHRNTVQYLYRIYKSVLDTTEECAWHKFGRNDELRVGLKGVPLIVRFSEPLTDAVFNRWVQMAFQKRNRFKLWGDPIRLGPRKVHVYGADRHLWQPINVEFSSEGVVAILPQGTCGNTFHRLVANIQHYVSPKITAWIGAEPFDSIVSKWPSDVERVDAN